MTKTTITSHELKGLTSRIFTSRGMSATHAKQIADVLVWADMSGHSSHGVSRIERYLAFVDRGDFDLLATPVLANSFGALLNWDGNSAAGAVAVNAALPGSITSAQEHGISLTSIINTTHVGASGYYVEQIASQGLIGIFMAAGSPLMTYHGSAAAAVSTAPIAIGLPRAGGASVLLDMASSVAALGKVRQAAAAGVPISEEWALDENGEPTSDAQKAVVMRPVGGPKGSGLALMIELISSVLPGVPILSMALATDAVKRHRQNVTMIVIDIEKLRPVEGFVEDVESLVTTLKAQPRQKGIDRILMPGERSSAERKRRSIDGIPLDTKLLSRLKELAG